MWQAASWHELLRPQVLSRAARSTAQDVGHAVGQLLSGPVRRTSLLLMFIWFANALNYYGLVLLTTTVRSFPAQMHDLQQCSKLMWAAIPAPGAWVWLVPLPVLLLVLQTRKCMMLAGIADATCSAYVLQPPC